MRTQPTGNTMTTYAAGEGVRCYSGSPANPLLLPTRDEFAESLGGAMPNIINAHESHRNA